MMEGCPFFFVRFVVVVVAMVVVVVNSYSMGFDGDGQIVAKALKGRVTIHNLFNV